MTQHFLIDLDERAFALRAAESLSEFQTVAGLLYRDYETKYGTPLPQYAWKQLAETLDQKSFALKDHLEPLGKKSLAVAIKACGYEINTWVQAFAFRATCNLAARIEPRPNENSDRYLGDLTQHAKKAVYRAKDVVENARKERRS